MNFDKIPEAKIFNNNSREDVTSWIHQLKYFRLLKARQGHNCEGDKWACYIKYTDDNSLKDILSTLGVELKSLQAGDIPFDPFEDVTMDKLDKIRYVIPELPNYIQPQDQVWNGVDIHIWIQNQLIEISVSGSNKQNSYMVSQIDFLHCQKLEDWIEKQGFQKELDLEIEKLSHCISKTKYPELYI